MINDLELSCVTLGGETDKDDEILLDADDVCWLGKRDAVRIIKHLAAVFEINLAEVAHND